MKPTDFAQALSTYLSAYLPGQKNVSTHTIHSYRDTFKLLLSYCQNVRGLAIERLALCNLDNHLIVGFLEWLEAERHNRTATRNQRLASIRPIVLGQDLPLLTRSGGDKKMPLLLYGTGVFPLLLKRDLESEGWSAVELVSDAAAKMAATVGAVKIFERNRQLIG
jgi:hypothetical protein